MDSWRGWSKNDRKKISSIVLPILEMQKLYGKVFNTELLMKGWEGILSEEFTADQVCYALKKYALKKGNDFPSPKDINDILCPEKPKISQTEFIHAKEMWAIDGYSEFSKWFDVIKGFENQESEKRENFEIENKTLLEIAGNSVKRISG